MVLRLGFFGGVGTVTGSKCLVETERGRVLVDCGLFQGLKALRLRNWDPLPFDPAGVDAVVLTDAHLDRSGYLPILVRNGFRGPVYATPATRDLCEVMLTDSGRLQERDAEHANQQGFSKHHPARPLHTEAEAVAALQRFVTVPFDQPFDIGAGLTGVLRPSGHILGSALLELRPDDTVLVFSGDLGRRQSPTMVDPATIRRADYLVLESTYGNRRHVTDDPERHLAELIDRVAARGGTVLIPAFAVGRTQTLLFHLYRLKAGGRIPDLPIYLDSPTAIDASEIYGRHIAGHRLTAPEYRAACSVATYVRDAAGSEALDRSTAPKVIIAASGMATGGRILHHLKRYAPDARNAVLFAGFQAEGTRGAAMLAGAETVKIHGQHVPVRAEVACLDMLSAHADSDEIMDWLAGFETPPRRTFVIHGEPAASAALRQRIADELGWPCESPDYGQTVELD